MVNTVGTSLYIEIFNQRIIEDLPIKGDPVVGKSSFKSIEVVCKYTAWFKRINKDGIYCIW